MVPIYLDNNATTAIHPEVAETMYRCLREGWANPASQHSLGRRARRTIEEARDGILEILGGDTRSTNADRLVFTSGGTESNNLGIRGLGIEQRRQVIISTIEHPSLAAAAEHLPGDRTQVVHLPVDPHGVVGLELLDDLITADTRIVGVMFGNNETGVLQPVAELAAICQRRGVPFYTDAVQAVGKIAVDFRKLGVDALGFAAHKFHGPVGVGGILLRHGLELRPILRGGFQQYALRPGTEPVLLVAGMFKALSLWQREAGDRLTRLTTLRDRLISALRSGYPGLWVNGELSPRLPHTVSVAFPGVERQALVMALDMAGIACSTGSACASGSSEPSHVLRAMGAIPAVIESSIRLSISAMTTEQEVEDATCRILNVVNELSQRTTMGGAVPTPRGPRAKSL